MTNPFLYAVPGMFVIAGSLFDSWSTKGPLLSASLFFGFALLAVGEMVDGFRRLATEVRKVREAIEGQTKP